jgi:hypothetical protein
METKPPDYSLIIGVITFIGVLINIIFLYRMQNKTRIDKYYDKILDKRLQAYELLENVLYTLIVKNEMNDKSGKLIPVHGIFMNYERFLKFKNEYIEMAKLSLWYSEKLTIDIVNFNTLLFEIENKFNPDDKNSCLIIGSGYHNEIVNYYLKLRAVHMEDLKTLYEVKEFIKNRHKSLADIKPI